MSRGRKYQRQGRVKDLVVSEEGRLLATVQGGVRYITSVWLTDTQAKSLKSQCTCPVGADGCKHAVAVVAEYLEQVAVESEIPTAEQDDPRWAKLSRDHLEDFDEDEDEFEDETEEKPPTPVRAKKRTRSDWDEKIRNHIEAKGREDLVELVWSLTERFPELREEFRERIALGEGDVDRLVKEARKELRRVTSEAGWQNNWTGEGNLPDYNKLKHRLERLVELGHCDAVAKLGEEIIERGMEQVGQSHDEGETAMELAECLSVVFDGVAKSSLPQAKKLLFVVDAHLHDDYDVIGDAANGVLEKDFGPADWSTVADEMARRLKSSERGKGTDDAESLRDYKRDQISRWLAEALTKAGREDEVLAVYEREAKATASYERLVNYLIGQKRYDDAQRWAREGIEKTREKLPGIAASLAKALCEVARIKKQWDIVAAHAAWEFFDRPAEAAFDALMDSATKAGYQERVRELALRFLESGVAPIRIAVDRKGDRKVVAEAAWPLQMPEYLRPLFESRQSFESPRPHYDVLIDMAISHKRPDDVLRWHDKMRAGRRSAGNYYGYGSSHYDDQVAEAVATSHPNRALEIYQQRVNDNLTRASHSAYETVAAYLRKMRPLFKALKRENEWVQMLSDIRIRYRNRPRFMEVLDTLEGKTIVQSQRDRH